MKILLAHPRGFCAGVNMAVESLRRALAQYGAPVYVFHEIVHNRTVVEDFRAQGAIFVENLAEVPPGGVVLYSAHGVSPEIRRQTHDGQLRAIDATCPLVTKVHSSAVRFAGQGYQIILIGHAGHDEVLGTLGEAPGAMHLVANLQDIAALEFPEGTKLAYLTQTTLSVDETRDLIEALKARFPGIAGPPKGDICYATTNRQQAVRELAPEADCVLVVGSQNSSNSQRLVDLGRLDGRPGYLVDGPGDMRAEWFEGVGTVLVTAGASAPEHVVQECIDWLRERFGASVEDRVLKQERVVFSLPPELG